MLFFSFRSLSNKDDFTKPWKFLDFLTSSEVIILLFAILPLIPDIPTYDVKGTDEISEVNTLRLPTRNYPQR